MYETQNILFNGGLLQVPRRELSRKNWLAQTEIETGHYNNHVLAFYRQENFREIREIWQSMKRGCE